MPIVFFAYFQFLGIFFSHFISELRFASSVSLSFFFALILTLYVCKKIKKLIFFTKIQLYLVLALSILSTYLFLLRLNWGVFDIICPTGILGLVKQVSNGNFPVVFLSFPEIVMNYHQGFIYICGVLSFLFDLSPYVAIKIALVIFYFLFAVAVSGFMLNINNKHYLLPVVLFVVVASLDYKYYIGEDLGWYNYISVFEYFGSTSWALSLPLFVALLYIFEEYKNTYEYLLIISSIILSVSTINGTLYSLIIISLIIMVCSRIAFQVKKDIGKDRYLYSKASCIAYYMATLVAFSIVLIVPKFIPSVFMAGENYSFPNIEFHIFSVGLAEFIKNTIYYFFLSGPIVGVVILFSIYFRKEVFRGSFPRSVMTIVLFISAIFPLLFRYSNIGLWDNYHKFALVNIFLSIILMMYILEEYKSRGILNALFVLIVVLSGPAIYDLFRNRTSFDGVSSPNR